jgi:hypothetical protein
MSSTIDPTRIGMNRERDLCEGCSYPVGAWLFRRLPDLRIKRELLRPW